MVGDGVVAARPSDLSRVYRVAGRIEHASEQRGCRRQLELVLSETAKAWANLTAFVANSPTRVSPAPGPGLQREPTRRQLGGRSAAAVFGRPAGLTGWR